MGLSKGDMMELTGNDRDVDSALPQPWLDKMSREMLIDYDSARFWYAYSYKNNSLNIFNNRVNNIDRTQISLPLDQSVFRN